MALQKGGMQSWLVRLACLEFRNCIATDRNQLTEVTVPTLSINANDALRDAVNRLHQGVLYFQSVILCHGSRVK